MFSTSYDCYGDGAWKTNQAGPVLKKQEKHILTCNVVILSVRRTVAGVGSSGQKSATLTGVDSGCFSAITNIYKAGINFFSRWFSFSTRT